MDQDELEGIVMEHEHILTGVNGKNGLVDKAEECYTWLQKNYGRSSVWGSIKDILLASGLVGVIVKFIIL